MSLYYRKSNTEARGFSRVRLHRTNIPNPHQGSLRYGTLDFDKLITRIRNDANRDFSIFVTHTNEVPIKTYRELELQRVAKHLYLSCSETGGYKI